MKNIRSILILISLCLSSIACLKAERIIQVTPNGVNDVLVIKQAIDSAKKITTEPVTIKLGGGTYNLHRNQATVVKYYISNTMSWSSGTDNLKYIGVYFKSANNITLDGEGAKLITHGEMTSVVVDGCENITLRNLSVNAADPSVTEMTAESISGNEIVYKVHPTSTCQVSGTTLKWTGEYGWSFTGGPVQLYDPERDITWRCGAPTDNAASITDLGNKRISIKYNTLPSVKVGYTYQMRDGVRDQVAGFLHKSKNIVYDHVNLNFLGNFGVVCQFSENLSFLGCRFVPEEGSGRTNAGFADFLQVSGCKGLVKVEDTYFSGAHDDPINVHGTYLKIQNYLSSTQTKVKFMHNESWGFDAFFVGDSIEFIDVASMMPIQSAKITAVQRNDDQNITLTFDKAIDVAAFQAKTSGVVVENITWTPEVEIRRNYFSRIPTRGVLLTTRRRSVIEDNTFFRMQMAGIYVSGDAASWYESGKVTDLTIRNNKFIECGSPVVYFDPTNSVNSGYVHSKVVVENNTFKIASGSAVGGKSVANLSFLNNTIIASGSATADSYASLSNSGTITKSGNIKLQPGTIILSGASVNASSSLTANDKALAKDGINTTSWKAAGDDTQKWWLLDLKKPFCLNRIQLVFPQSDVWKYRIEVSTDSASWMKVIDQTDNTSSVASHSNAGNLGENVRYVRVVFNSASAALAEVNVFGEETLTRKKNLLNGTVIGTTGSWNNDAAATRDAVYDFNTNSYFDAPSGLGWAGLDLGYNACYRIDSIRFAPRSTNLDRMVNGTFEISNSPTFATKTVLYTVTATPPAGYTLVPISNAATGRYIRYSGPANGFGNISEVEFFGSSVLSVLKSLSQNDILSGVVVDKKNKVLRISFNENMASDSFLSFISMQGVVMKKVSIRGQLAIVGCDNLPAGTYICSIQNKDVNTSFKIIL